MKNDKLRFPVLIPDNEKVALWFFDKLSTILDELDDGLFDRFPLTRRDLNSFRLKLYDIIEADLGNFVIIKDIKVELDTVVNGVRVSLVFEAKEDLYAYLEISEAIIKKIYNYSFIIPVLEE